MDAALRAGIAIYNADEYHAAHDAWEGRWLDLERGTDDERFLHGLIQFTAAVFHASRGNHEGCVGLSKSARDYLSDLPADYQGVNLGAVRSSLARLAADPSLLDRENPPKLTYEGRALTLADLDLDATFVAAPVLAEELGFDEGAVEQAVEYARRDLAAGDEGSAYVSLLFAFVGEADRRATVAQRLRERVERRAARETDVEGLFD